MPKKILFILCLFFIAKLPASYAYIKIGSMLPPIEQNGSLPAFGIGGRMSGSYLDYDLSLTGATKKKNSYITAKGLLLFYTGSRFYIGGGGGIGYGAKKNLLKLVRGGKDRATTINLEGVIGYEYCAKFIQFEFSKSIFSRNVRLDNKMGFAVIFGTRF